MCRTIIISLILVNKDFRKTVFLIPLIRETDRQRGPDTDRHHEVHAIVVNPGSLPTSGLSEGVWLVPADRPGRDELRHLPRSNPPELTRLALSSFVFKTVL